MIEHMLRELCSTMQQCDDASRQLLQLPFPRAFSQCSQTFDPLLISPMPQNHSLDFCGDQFPDTPPSPPSLRVQLRPEQAANALASASFDQQSVKQLPVQPQFGQRRVATRSQGVEIEQTLQPFYRNFHLPSHPIQFQHNFGWKNFRRQGCHDQDITSKEQRFGFRLSSVLLAFLSQAPPRFLGFAIFQTIGVNPSLNFPIAFSRFDSRLDRLNRLCRMATQLLIEINPSSFRVIKWQIVGTHSRNNICSALLDANDLIGVSKASIRERNISFNKGKLRQTFA